MKTKKASKKKKGIAFKPLLKDDFKPSTYKTMMKRLEFHHPEANDYINGK